MDTKLIVRGHCLTIRFVPGIVRILIDAGLESLLAVDTHAATDDLVLAIKKEYFRQSGSVLAIPHASFAVEIWAHVYANAVAIWIKRISSWSLIVALCDKIIRHAKMIDIGERKHDSNRVVWDRIAFLRPVIAFFLPK